MDGISKTLGVSSRNVRENFMKYLSICKGFGLTLHKVMTGGTDQAIGCLDGNCVECHSLVPSSSLDDTCGIPRESFVQYSLTSFLEHILDRDVKRVDLCARSNSPDLLSTSL